MKVGLCSDWLPFESMSLRCNFSPTCVCRCLLYPTGLECIFTLHPPPKHTDAGEIVVSSVICPFICRYLVISFPEQNSITIQFFLQNLLCILSPKLVPFDIL